MAVTRSLSSGCVVAAGLLLSLAAPGAHAQSNRDSAALLLNAASHGQATVVNTFEGPAGLTGVEVEDQASKRRFVAWLADGRYLLVGALFDSGGRNDTVAAEQALRLRPPPLEAAQAAALAGKLKGVVLGTGGPLVTAFFDPDCIYCRQLYERLLPSLDQGRLRLRVIVVAIVKRDSLARAAAILAASDPAAALKLNESAFDANKEEGGVKPAPAVDQKSAKMVTEATRALFVITQGRPATPTLIYEGPHGPVVQTGLPADLNALLAVK